MRIEDEYKWLSNQLGQSDMSLNNMWMLFLGKFEGTLKDRQMRYWQTLGCTHFDDNAYWTYNKMKSWWCDLDEELKEAT